MTLFRRLWRWWWDGHATLPAALPVRCQPCLDDYGVLLALSEVHAPLCAKARRDVLRALANGEKVTR